MDANHQRLIDTYAEANAVSGQLCQFSRALLQSGDLDAALKQANNLLLNIGASGFIRLSCATDSKRSFFNQGVSRQDLLSLQSLAARSDKICCDHQLLQIKTLHVYLVVEVSKLQPYQKDILTDHLAIFVDTLDAWLQLYEQKAHHEQDRLQQNNHHAQLLHQSISQLEQISDNLKMSYQQLIQELLCNFTRHFPTMALEHDQEELILAIAEHECDKHASAVSKQLSENRSLIALLNATAQQLTQTEEQQDKMLSNGQSIELF